MVCAEVTMEERQELLEHWKWIVRAVFQAEYNLRQHGERINREAEDKEKEADRWVTLVADEILSNTIDNEEDDKLQQNQREVAPPFRE